VCFSSLFGPHFAGRIGFAIVRSESLRDDLALPTLALFVLSAVLGSRLWSQILARKERGS
jgi:hypothetical protein